MVGGRGLDGGSGEIGDGGVRRRKVVVVVVVDGGGRSEIKSRRGLSCFGFCRRGARGGGFALRAFLEGWVMNECERRCISGNEKWSGW